LKEVLLDKLNVFKNRVITMSIVFAIVGFVIYEVRDHIKIIETGNVGVETNLGQIERKELKPGIHFQIPIIQKIEDVYTKTIMVNYTDGKERVVNGRVVKVLPKDTKGINYEYSLRGEDTTGLEMAIDMIVEVKPVENEMADMFIEVGRDGFEKKVLQPIRGIARTVLGQYKAENIMSQRRELANDIRKGLSEIFSRNPYYKLVNVELKKIYLPPKVQKAIEKVQLAKQEAKAKEQLIKANAALAQSKVELAKGEARAVEIKAKAEAQKIKIEAEAQSKANLEIAKSLTPELIELKQIKAWEKGGSQIPRIMTGDKGLNLFVKETSN